VLGPPVIYISVVGQLCCMLYNALLTFEERLTTLTVFVTVVRHVKAVQMRGLEEHQWMVGEMLAKCTHFYQSY
jgi:hypothetical protein